MGDSALASGMRGQDISPCSMQSRVLLCWGRGEGIQGVESVNKTSHEWQAWMVAAKKPSFESRRLLSLIVSLVRCSLVWSNGKDLAQEPSQLGLLHEHQQEQTPKDREADFFSDAGTAGEKHLQRARPSQTAAAAKPL